jgi:transposase InsO family protein
MAQHGLFARDGRRKKLRTTLPDVTAPPLADLVQRDFSVGAPGERACGDITHVATDEGWLFLADVCDIGSRRIVGFAMADHMRTELVGSALKMAVAQRGGLVEGMTFHHDRGAQVNTCRASSASSVGATASPSRRGARARATTTRWPSRSGRPSNQTRARLTGCALPPESTPAGRSSSGSTTTTRCLHSTLGMERS